MFCDQEKGVKAEARDYEMTAREWTFNLKKLQIPVLIWFGEEDVESVVQVGGPYLEKTIPNARSFKIPERGIY